MKTGPEYKPCLFCGKLISPGRFGKRLYCTAGCKQAHYRLRKSGVTTPKRPVT